MSAKYPRSFHLPWSPGGTSDDKRLRSVSALVGVEIVITEKCDGSNLTYTRQSVFARSHSGPPQHPSFGLAKATHGRIAPLLSEGLSVFCEYCYAVHSIAYDALPDHSLVFGVRDDASGLWWDWDMVVAQAAELGLPTVPVLFRGAARSEAELRALTERLAAEPSQLGGAREGVVVRRAGQFSDTEFSVSLGKWVRRDHVQTDEHWMHQTIVPQKLTDREKDAEYRRLLAILKVPDEAIRMATRVGSRVYGTARPGSDHDYLVVLCNPEQRRDLVFRDDVNIVLHGVSSFQASLDAGSVFAFEGAFAPAPHVLKAARPDFPAEVDRRKLVASATERSTSDYEKAVKRLADEPEASRKRLFHSLRIPAFALQLARTGELDDFAVANQWFEAIMACTGDDVAGLAGTYGPLRAAMCDELMALGKQPRSRR